MRTYIFLWRNSILLALLRTGNNVLSSGGSALSAVQNEGNMRISIGSDSEKTIQEKYWKLTLGSLNSAIRLLRYGLPRFSPEREDREDQHAKTPKEYETARLDINEFMVLKNSTSFAMFRKNLEGYRSDMKDVCKKRKIVLNIASENFKAYQKEMVAKRLSYELGEWSVEDLEDEYSVRIEEEAKFIRHFCTDIAEAIGNMSPDHLAVELDYDPDEIDWQSEMRSMEQEKLPPQTEAHIELLDLIHEVSHAVVRAVQENGMFILSAMN